MATIAEILEAKGMGMLHQQKINGSAAAMPTVKLEQPGKYLSKQCKSCGESKVITEFAKTLSGGRQATCLECRTNHRLATLREKAAERKRLESVFTCNRCAEEKPVTERCPGSWKNTCRECRRAYYRAWLAKRDTKRAMAQPEAPTFVVAAPIERPSLWKRFMAWITGA